MKDFSEIENMFDHEKGSSKKLSEVRNQLNNLVSEFAEAIVEMTIKHTAQVSALQAENEALRQRVTELEGELKPALESGDILYRARHINRDVAPDVSMNLAISAGKITKLGDLLGLSKDIPPLYIGNCEYCQEEFYEGDNPLITSEGMYCSADCTDDEVTETVQKQCEACSGQGSFECSECTYCDGAGVITD